MSTKLTKAELDEFTDGVTRALRRAAKTARKIACQSGTSVYVCRAGKIVAIKPKNPCLPSPKGLVRQDSQSNIRVPLPYHMGIRGVNSYSYSKLVGFDLLRNEV